MISKYTLWLALGSLGMIIFASALQAQAPPMAIQVPVPAAPPSKASDGSNADVAKATEKLRLITAGYKAGISTHTELSEAVLALAIAQLHSAVSLNDAGAIQQALETIVVQRQQLLRLTEAEYTAGTVNTDVMTQAQTALALATVRVGLYNLVNLRRQSLSQAQIRNRSGAVAPQELTEAQDAYRAAQRLFSESGEPS